MSHFASEASKQYLCLFLTAKIETSEKLVKQKKLFVMRHFWIFSNTVTFALRFKLAFYLQTSLINSILGLSNYFNFRFKASYSLQNEWFWQT